jgi:hypothetical protein
MYQHALQIGELETCEMTIKNIEIYKKQKETISSEIKQELYKYPSFEREIFENISPEQLSLYMVKYPELKSSETMLALTNQLISLQKTIYNNEIKKNLIIKGIKYRNKNKILYSYFMPRYKINY